MYYATEEEFTALYPNAEAGTYDRFAWDAQKYIDNATSGVDGVKKLQIAFPTDEDDAEAVKRGFCAIINALKEVNDARAAMQAAAGYNTTAAGMVSQNVKSISAGGESISYGADAGNESAVTAAAKSNGELKGYIGDLCRHYLAGAHDGNGVNLLYGGCYPREYL